LILQQRENEELSAAFFPFRVGRARKRRVVSHATPRRPTRAESVGSSPGSVGSTASAPRYCSVPYI